MDLEGALEDPEAVENSFTLKDFSELEIQIEYQDAGRYTAVTEEYTIHIEYEDGQVKVRTGENNGEETYLKKFSFGENKVELPDKIGGRGTNPIESALRSYAHELYPEKQEKTLEDEWSMDYPPAERE